MIAAGSGHQAPASSPPSGRRRGRAGSEPRLHPPRRGARGRWAGLWLRWRKHARRSPSQVHFWT